MKYAYAVKANGKWYRPNEEVPESTVSQKGNVNVSVTVDASAIQPVVSQVKEVQSEKAVEDEPRQRGRRRKDY